MNSGKLPDFFNHWVGISVRFTDYLLLIALLLITSCHSGHENHSHDENSTHRHTASGEPGHHDHGKTDDHSDAHAEETPTTAFTVWQDGYEIFLEHEVIVVGKAVRFITHVTNLASSQPRTSGPVTFIFQQGDEEPIRHLEPQPKRPGIYIPERVFANSGIWKMGLNIPEETGERTLSLPSVHAYAARNEIPHHHDEEDGNGISFLKEQQWNIDFFTQPAVARELKERLRLTGVVTLPSENQAVITAQVSGSLQPAGSSLFPRMSQRVESGQTLALIQPYLTAQDLLTLASAKIQYQLMDADFTSKIAESEARRIQADAEITLAEQSHHRIRELHSKNAKSQKQLEEAEYNLHQAKANGQAAETMYKTYLKAQNSLASHPEFTMTLVPVELKAPISGLISEIRATVGENIPAGMAVFTITDLAQVYIEVRVPESEWGRIGASNDAVFALPYAPGNYRSILSDSQGSMVFKGFNVDQSRTIAVVYKVSNPDRELLPGMALNVFIETAHIEQALAIHESAVVEEDGRPIAFVQVSGETFQKRHLELGIQDGNHFQVLSGINPGERVVTRGAYALRLASVSTSIPAHGHAH